MSIKNLTLCISVIVAAALCGCQEPEKRSEGPSIEGLKLSDLIPSTAEKLPSAIKLRLLTFDIPRQYLLQLDPTIDALGKENIKFANRKAFDRNAFAAGIGDKEAWSIIGDELKAAKAKKISTSIITIRDRDGYEVPVKEIGENVSLIYTNADSRVIQHDLFSGTISFRIKAGPVARRKGTANIKIEAISRSLNPTIISKAAGNEEFGLTVFHSLSMMMKMEEGQFLILAPQATLAKAKTEVTAAMNLAELFFFSRGDFVTRKGDSMQYEIQRDIALARIYMLVCTEVQN